MPQLETLHFKFGCDPELFVKEIETGMFVSAHTLLPGTKEAPFKIDNGAIQVDGVAAEFNIDPAINGYNWRLYIQSVMQQLKVHIGPKHELVVVPAVIFDEAYFATLPEDVRVLGCNMDYNAWTKSPNPRPDGASTTLRTAAGHIHLGWTEGADPKDPDHFEDCCEVVKQLDYYLGVPSLFWDNDPRRRSLYGKAGAFRPKSYGVEYRTLSNRWLTDPKLIDWVQKAAHMALTGMLYSNIRMVDRFGNMAQELIDRNELELAKGEFKNKVWKDTEMHWPTW